MYNWDGTFRDDVTPEELRAAAAARVDQARDISDIAACLLRGPVCPSHLEPWVRSLRGCIERYRVEGSLRLHCGTGGADVLLDALDRVVAQQERLIGIAPRGDEAEVTAESVVGDALHPVA